MQPKRTIPRVCEQCGDDFFATVSAVNAGKARFCSMGCYTVWKTDRPLGPRTAIVMACATCGVAITKPPCEIRERNYCSTRCQHSGRPKWKPPAPVIADDGLTALIPLLTRSGIVRAHVVVDAADAEWASQWRWHLDKDGYAVREERVKGERRRILLHRALLGLSSGDAREGDHMDRVRLNCRRGNLRPVPKFGNLQNVSAQIGSSSVYRGVSWDKARCVWVAQVSTGRKNHVVGAFSDELEAAEAARDGRQRLLPYAVD